MIYLACNRGSGIEGMGRPSALHTLSTLSGSTPSQPLALNDEIRADMMLSTLEIHEAL